MFPHVWYFAICLGLWWSTCIKCWTITLISARFALHSAYSKHNILNYTFSYMVNIKGIYHRYVLIQWMNEWYMTTHQHLKGPILGFWYLKTKCLWEETKNNPRKLYFHWFCTATNVFPSQMIKREGGWKFWKGVSIAIYWRGCLCFTTDNPLPPPPFRLHLLITSRLLGISTTYYTNMVRGPGEFFGGAPWWPACLVLLNWRFWPRTTLAWYSL